VAENLLGKILEDLAACGRSLREPPGEVAKEKETKVQTPDGWKKLYGSDAVVGEREDRAVTPAVERGSRPCEIERKADDEAPEAANRPAPMARYEGEIEQALVNAKAEPL